MLVLLMIMFIFSFSACCKDNVWLNMRPLKTTREDVEKLLGKPKPYSVARYSASYETSRGDASFLYSRSNCDSEDNSGWNVPELTVIEIKFYPKSKVRFSDLDLDMKKFEKQPDPEITFIDEYSNYSDGIAIRVDKEENVVLSFRYFPNDHDRRSLLCKTKVKPEH